MGGRRGGEENEGEWKKRAGSSAMARLLRLGHWLRP